MTKDVSLTDAQVHITEMVNDVAYGDQRVRLVRHGKPLAALVTIHDLELLESLDAGETRLVGDEPLAEAS